MEDPGLVLFYTLTIKCKIHIKLKENYPSSLDATGQWFFSCNIKQILRKTLFFSEENVNIYENIKYYFTCKMKMHIRI